MASFRVVYGDGYVAKNTKVSILFKVAVWLMDSRIQGVMSQFKHQVLMAK